ncbi:TPA: hemagglutinin repeat-containing protein [Stenotrophomonas maltophilia]|uniref:Uncharacterized protein n=1 Tax=Stenotrophomonas maltophilia TaxID=40324 RepID=A0A0F5ZMB4_STEMA|nr:MULTISPECIES: hemagglutinin repeat-containing protein [Stenotrophomonas]MCV4211143.1 hemagglutinin repeat-containing protein [Pseudomonas cichorii]KKD56828.1 hypothetical protein VM57_18700 [Stenotrophomonas maltophilia]MCA0092810.1 hemagglutinin repeat-containing protein [Stenotrophomonas maltophilia]MDV5768067.1 hemagglutinin repeat-containing protein [Stenotrophomonas maltophilia]OMO39471.1 hypothetical protein BU225_18550 [Stenotrophomonas sp. MB339]
MAARQTGQSSKNKSGSGEIGFSIGGNLSIISEQDTDDYASKQTQADGTFLCGNERWSGGQHLSFVARRGCLQLCCQPSLAPPERC